MSRHTEAVIDLAHCRANYRLAQRFAGSAKVLAVVKANAYGHGAVQVARAIPAADAFGVATLDEAIELRRAGIEKPMVLLEGFFEAAELPVIVDCRLDIVVHTPAQVQALLATRLARPLIVWLKHDSGMHRLGLGDAELRAAHAQLRHSANVAEIRLLSHFARADEPAHAAVVAQLDAFARAAAGLSGAVSLANSAALVALPQTRRDWVRPGIMLYGASPFSAEHAVAAELRPAMTLRSRLIALRPVALGDGVGYGGDWCAPRDSRIGTVAIGYADGYPRHARSGTPVLVRGRRVPLAGRVSMDMISVDLTEVPDAQLGDEVTLWGAGLPATEVAGWADTIAYQLFTGIGRRVQFLYLNA